MKIGRRVFFKVAGMTVASYFVGNRIVPNIMFGDNKKNSELFSCLGGIISESRANSMEVFPLGINNPITFSDVDRDSPECLQENSVLIERKTYVERHINVEDIKFCAPTAVRCMKEMRDIGINVISQHFPVRYTDESLDAKPYFGLEEWRHRNHETAVQLYINGFKNYFWAAVEPASGKYFSGDIEIIKPDGPHKAYLPNSEEGLAEFQAWLTALFDYLDDHQATDKLLYIQLGNESDGDYRKIQKADPSNPDDYYWIAYAKLIEKSYYIIRQRAPYTKIAIGALSGLSVSIDGFYRPVLEYLAGRIDENRNPINAGIWTKGKRLCDGTGCFDVFDYHDFSGHTEPGERISSRHGITIVKSPATFRKLLDETGFDDKKGLVVQQGGTPTGSDEKVKAMAEYQTEEDQASYLVNRFLTLIAQGVEQIQFCAYLEHYGYHGTIHNWFTAMGLMFNDTPEQGKIPDYQKQDPKPEDYNKDNCDGQLPCPDPGQGVKKLSWFSYKKVIGILNGSDWKKVETLSTGVDNTFAYKFVKKENYDNVVYALTWYWWKDCPRDKDVVEQYKEYRNNHTLLDQFVNESNSNCLEQKRPTVTIKVNKGVNRVKVTEAVPMYTTGMEADIAGYDNAFYSEIKNVIDGKVEITLGRRPVYVEEIVGPSISITYPNDKKVFVLGSAVVITAELKNVNNAEKVLFYINGKGYKTRPNKPVNVYDYHWRIPQKFSQTYVIQAKAFDKKGNVVVESDPVTVFTNNPPSLHLFIVNPENDVQMVRGGQSEIMTIKAKFLPDESGIINVMFYIKDKTGKYRVTHSVSRPNSEGLYVYNWNVPKKSSEVYEIWARGYTQERGVVIESPVRIYKYNI